QWVRPLFNPSGLLLVPHSYPEICGILEGSAEKASSISFTFSRGELSLNLNSTTCRSTLSWFWAIGLFLMIFSVLSSGTSKLKDKMDIHTRRVKQTFFMITDF